MVTKLPRWSLPDSQVFQLAAGFEARHSGFERRDLYFQRLDHVAPDRLDDAVVRTVDDVCDLVVKFSSIDSSMFVSIIGKPLFNKSAHARWLSACFAASSLAAFFPLRGATPPGEKNAG
jgi:hypothetical protein